MRSALSAKPKLSYTSAACRCASTALKHGATDANLHTSERRIFDIVQQDLNAATERSKAATAAFDAVTREIPSGIPQPDGTQRIHNASREVTIARMEMLKPHHRLNDFLNAGVVPIG
jgi:hypothetical protein